MSPRFILVSLALLAGLAAPAGCFAPELTNLGFICSGDGDCPEGHSCVKAGAEMRCRRDGIPLPDGLLAPDMKPTPDIIPPSCPVTGEMVASGVSLARDSIGLALTKAVDPHLVSIDAATGELLHHVRDGGGSWIQRKVGARGTTLAVAMDGSDRLHLLFGHQSTANLPHHTFADVAKVASWSPPQAVVITPPKGTAAWASPSSDSLDLAIRGDFMVGVVAGTIASGYSMTPFLIQTSGTAGYKYRWDAHFKHATSSYSPVRAAVGPARYLLSWIWEDSRIVKWVEKDFLHGTVYSSIKPKIAQRTPTLVGRDRLSGSNLAWVRTTAAGIGDLYVLRWPGGFGLVMQGDKIFPTEKVRPDSLDLALDAEDIVYLSVTGASSGKHYWLSQKSVSTWPAVILDSSDPVQTRLEVAGKELHFASLDAKGVLRHHCRLLK